MKITTAWVCAILSVLIVVGVWAQEAEIITPFAMTTLYKVDTNSTVIYNAPSQGTPGQSQKHYLLYENRGSTVLVFDWVSSIQSTNLVINGSTITTYIGHVLNPLDTYEIPSEKVNNYPLSAISTNNASQGILAVTVGYHKS